MSSAVSGVLGAYFCLFPRATASTFLLAGFLSRIVELPAAFYWGLWFFMQLSSGLFLLGHASEQGMLMTAFWAHASGFVIGLLATKVLVKTDSLGKASP